MENRELKGFMAFRVYAKSYGMLDEREKILTDINVKEVLEITRANTLDREYIRKIICDMLNECDVKDAVDAIVKGNVIRRKG